MKLAFAWMIGASMAAIPLVADTGGAMTDLPVQLVSQLGGMGFVVWFAWYTITRTVPSLSEKYDEGLRAALNEARAARDEFRQELDQVLDAHTKATNELAAVVRDMVSHCKQHQAG